MAVLKSIRIPIISKIFILIMMLSVTQSIFLFLITHAQMKNDLINNKKSEIHSQLILLQETLNHSFNDHDIHEIKNIIPMLHGDKNLTIALFVDDSEKILASTKSVTVGLGLNEVLPETDILLVHEKIFKAKKRLKNLVWSEAGSLIINAVSPVVDNNVTASTLRTRTVGVIYLQVNMARKYKASELSLIYSFVIEFVVVFFIGIIIAVYLYFLVIKRLNAVNYAAKSFTDVTKKINLKEVGDDEITDLYIAFNTMSNTLYKQHQSILTQETRLLRTQKLAHLGSWELDLESQLFSYSEEANRVFGVAGMKTSFDDYILSAHASDREILKTEFLKSLTKNERGFELEHRIIDGMTGNEKHVLQKCVVDRDDQGGVIRCHGMVMDITQQKQAEKESQSNSEKFLRWKESNFIGIVQMSLDGSIIDANQAMLDMIGYNKDELNSGVLNWKTLTPKEFSDRDDYAIIEAAEKGYWTPFEKEYIHKSGRRVPVILGGALFQTDPPEYIVFILDVSNQKSNERQSLILFEEIEEKNRKLEAAAAESKRSEQEQKDILNFFVHTVILINEKGTIVYVNRAAEVLFKYTKEEMEGKNISSFMPEPFKSNHDKYMNNYLLTGTKKIIGIGRKVEALTKLNEILPIHLSVAELPQKSSGERLFIGICVDLTRDIQQQEEKRRNQKLVGLGNLAGGVAHDFNNLLAIINGYAELLSDEIELKGEYKDYINEILKAGNRGSSLTKRLLGFSKEKMLAPKVVSVNQLIMDNAANFQNILSSNILLKIELQENAWHSFLDSSDLLDAIINIAINAKHAMGTGGTFTISTLNLSLNEVQALDLKMNLGDYIKLSLEDSGAGMDIKTKEQIFDPFFSTKGDSGTGLGLSQVYGFIKRVSGRIRVESELGVGSCFNLYFPRHKGGLAKASDLITADPSSFNAGQYTVLVVDDEDALKELADSFLRQSGFKTLNANSAEQAINLLQVNNVDLVLSDVIMGGMNGYALYQYVKSHYSTCKFLLMSGFDDEVKVNTDEKSLQHKLLHKPYRRDELIAAVKAELKDD